MWRWLRDALNTLVDAVEDAVEAVVDWIVSAVEVFFDMLVHLIRFVWFAVTLRFEMAGRELIEIGRNLIELINIIILGAIGMILQVGAILIGAVQRIIGIEGAGRRLNDIELNYLRPIFGDSVNYNAVLIIDGNLGVFNISGAITIGNTIRNSSTTASFPLTNAANYGVLVHEMVHVWQYQNGGARYIPQALIAQWFTNVTGDWVRYPLATDAAGNISTVAAPRGYGFQSTLDASGQWDGLNTEQQATLIDAAFAFGMDFNDPANFNFIFPAGGTDYTTQLQFAAGLIRQGRGVPIWPPVTLPLNP